MWIWLNALKSQTLISAIFKISMLFCNPCENKPILFIKTLPVNDDQRLKYYPSNVLEEGNVIFLGNSWNEG